MPIFEYQCNDCNVVFETLELKGDKTNACPECSSENIKKLASAFGTKKRNDVRALSTLEAAYSDAAEFNEKLEKGELENPQKERERVVKNFQETSPLFKKGREKLAKRGKKNK